MYTTTDYKTKKALKDAIEKGEKVRVYQPGPFGNGDFQGSGEVSLEGPHYPKPHTWYARAVVDHGVIIKIK